MKLVTHVLSLLSFLLIFLEDTAMGLNAFGSFLRGKGKTRYLELWAFFRQLSPQSYWPSEAFVAVSATPRL